MTRSVSTLAVAVATLMGLAAPITDLRAQEPESIPPPILHIALDRGDLDQLQRAAAPALLKAPDPLPVVHVEGTLPTAESYRRASRSRRDWELISTFASVYAVTGERRYLDRYDQYLSAWLVAYRISGNPIDETELGYWLLAYRTAGGALPHSVQARMRAFACDLSARYQESQPPGRKTSMNNWQSHRAKLAVMGAFACGEHGLISRAITVFKNQIHDNLLPTGEAIDFFERDAIHYVVYSLEPLLEAALFASLYGTDLFDHIGPRDQSISRTLEWLAPYARGKISHQEFAHSTVRFDAERAAAQVPGFSGPFDPHKARYAYWLASQLDSRWGELSLSLGQPPASRRAPWLAK